MLKRIYEGSGLDYKLVSVVEAEPVCGEDFCDDCGDCLHCYSGDECYRGGQHIWIEYREKQPHADRKPDE